MELIGEELSCYSNKMSSVRWGKCPHDDQWPVDKAYFSDIRVRNISKSLPARWRREQAGIDIKRNYVTVTLCIFATVGGQFITLSVRRCLQYDARKAARCAGPSATPNICRIVLCSNSICRKWFDHQISLIKYDTIQDAILTCARKLTWVSSIYRSKEVCSELLTFKLLIQYFLYIYIFPF